MIPTDLIHLICEFVPQYRLLDWITKDMIDKKELEKNIYAFDLSPNCRQLDYTKDMFPEKIKECKDNIYKLLKKNQRSYATYYIEGIDWDKLYGYPEFSDLCNELNQLLKRKESCEFKEIISDYYINYGCKYDICDHITKILRNLCEITLEIYTPYFEENSYFDYVTRYQLYKNNIINKRGDMLELLKRHTNLIIPEAFSSNPHIFKPVFNDYLKSKLWLVFNFSHIYD